MKPTLASHLNTAFRVQKLIIPVITSVIVGVIAAAVTLTALAQADFTFVKSIGPHVAILLQIQDGPELQRFIETIAKERDVQIEVAHNNKVVASSKALSSIGALANEEETGVELFNSKLTANDIITASRVKLADGSQQSLTVKTSLMPVLGISLLVFAATLLGCFVVLRVFANAIVRKAQNTIEPVRQLAEEIRQLENFGLNRSISDADIAELAEITSAIVSTREKLSLANDLLAEAKAKSLLADSYASLIHDLKTPVTSLNAWNRVANDSSQQEDVREEARERIIALSEQVLAQVAAAKSNLHFNVKLIENSDICKTVTNATQDAVHASEGNITVECDVPDQNVFKSHDPILLSRAVSNLVSNAIYAAKSDVLVKLLNVSDRVIISVSDDGPGLSATNVSLHLQGKGKSTKANRNGIGLANANHIVKSHGGRLLYKNSDTGGACFEIQL